MSDENDDYEARRRANIERNKKLLHELELQDYALRAETDIGGGKRNSPSVSSRGAVRNNHQARNTKRRKPNHQQEDAKDHYDLRPLRSSARLRGIPAESKEAQVKREQDDMEAQRQAERARLTRIAGDLDLGKMTNGISYKEAQSLLSSFKDVKDTLAPKEGAESTNADIRKTSSELSNMKLYERFTPNELKLTPERIYFMGFHPTVDKKIVLGGDKSGNLGIWNADQVRTIPSGEEDEEDDEEPEIANFKVHSRTISSFVFDVANSQNLYTSSYDGSIRCFDLVGGKSTETYFPTSGYYEDEAISIVDCVEPHILYFSTLAGRLYCKDTREKPSKFQQRLRCHGKKIGGMALNPSKPYQVLTASLDRTMKLWDLRQLHKSTILSSDEEEDANIQSPSLVGEYESRLSVSAVSWNSHNQAVCNGYDDTINVFDLSKTAAKGDNDPCELKPNHRIRHNCQTGRWVTILRAHWQRNAPDGVDKFIIGDMNKSMDIYSGTGELLARLADQDSMSAVPAACNMHPTMNWAAGGTASGKVCLYY